MVPASEGRLSACRPPERNRRREAVSLVERSDCLARACGRDRLGERWPVLPLLGHDTRYGCHPCFPGAAAQENDAGHTPQPRPCGRTVSRSTLSYGLPESSENYASRAAATSASALCQLVGWSTGDTVVHDPRRRRPTLPAETGGEIAWISLRPTTRRRLGVRRRRRPGSARAGSASVPLKPAGDTPGAGLGAGIRVARRRHRKKICPPPIFLLQSRQNIL